ncbi:MAG: dihydroorotate dehydrogenase electron transfer subunit [Candidatus Zixiibacteriota bacterium]
MIVQQKIPIISCDRVSPLFCRLRFFSHRIARESYPGNFVHIRIHDNSSPLLRRAFSIHKTGREKGTFDILFKVVGQGTKLLSLKKPGQELDVLGPLGNTFTLPKRSNLDVILVAGGMGIAPLFFLASELYRNNKSDSLKISLLYGVKNKDEFLYIKELKDLGIEVLFATEDGTQGFEGLVTNLFLNQIKKSKNQKKTKIFSCGPPAMLKVMSEYAKEYNLNCEASLENHMPCGVGACMGCVVKHGKKNKLEYKRVCKEGPVFNAREVWLD